MIKNKTIAIILAIFTFLAVSTLLTIIIFYLFGYPLSSLAEHQLYVFLAILAGALAASMVYGRGTKERAAEVAQILNNSLGISVEEKVIWKVLNTLDQLPPFVVNKYVTMNINAVEEFEDQINDQKNKLSDDDLLKIRKIIENPVDKLQEVLNELYTVTDMEQFKIMADPTAKPLIELNLGELKRVLFNA
jgi:hypothetical protein